MLVINGAHGEGGGQILRTSLSLATILKRPVQINNIRANRKNPGLAAQHLTAVKAAAVICEAHVIGDELGSTRLTFEPQSRPISGLYEFDVSEAREGGSAGAATLVLQTILLPLALAEGSSTVILKGGTHVAWSPSFHYLNEVYLPAVACLGIHAIAELKAWGWYPAGQGEIRVEIAGKPSADNDEAPDNTVQWLEPGELQQVAGVAVASSLPAHIAQRMSDHATRQLQKAGIPAAIDPKRVRSVSPGAGIFLTAEYTFNRAGFGAIGKKGKPAEYVAEDVVEALLAFHKSGAAIETHLADQLILPIAATGANVTFSAQSLSRHTMTNIWVVERFLGPVVTLNKNETIIQCCPKN